MSQKHRYAYDILRHLVEHGETEQKELPLILGCSYRTVLREIEALELMNYIEFVRKRPNGGRGRPRNVWKATIFGLFTVIKQIVQYKSASDAVENWIQIPIKIIQEYSDSLLIFQEWQYLTHIKKINRHFQLMVWLYFTSRGWSIENFEEDRISAGSWSRNDADNDYWKEFSRREMKWKKDDLYSFCFGLRDLLETNISSEDDTQQFIISEYLPYCLENPHLKLKIVDLLENEYKPRFNKYRLVQQLIN